ncbi:MAG: hypothetical protein U0R71_01120 [Solirubrobacterales bacterium]
MANALHDPTATAVHERLSSLGAAGRLAAYQDGELTLSELNVWAALYPEEVPLVNGELPWIVASLADFD